MSAVISLTPLITLLVVYVVLAVWPTAEVGEALDTLGLIGALLVVAGSMMTALGRGAHIDEPVDFE